MSRTVSGGLAAHLATRRTRLSRCVRLDLRDGTTLGITDHDRDLEVDLGDGAVTYRADVGVIPSAISLGLGFEAGSCEIEGPVGEVVTADAVLGGRYHRARARIFDVRWDAPASFLRLMAGKVAEASLTAGGFKLQVRSSADAFNQVIGRVLSPQCSHDFGIGQCQADPDSWDATVSAVTDDLRFTVAWDGVAPSAEDIRNGLVAFTGGQLVGVLPVEVFNLAGAVIEVYEPLVEAPQVGDTLTVTEGCDKLRATCKLKGQILNFGGFPDVGGTDAYVKFPNPGSDS